MFIRSRFGIFFCALMLFSVTASAQRVQPLTASGTGSIYLDVVVTPKFGHAVSGLQQQDFAVLDNKVPVAVTSFQAFSGNQASVEVIVVIDAVNVDYERVSFAREQVEKFLRADGGHLSRPTSLAFFTDTGTQIEDGFSTDGNALSALLKKYTIGLRDLRRSSGFYGAAERFSLSLQALSLLTTREAARPGRKIIVWVSPGWPLLSGPGVQLVVTRW